MEKRQKSNKGMILSLVFLTLFMAGFASASNYIYSGSSSYSSSCSSSCIGVDWSWPFVNTFSCPPKDIPMTCEDFGFDFSVAKWEWQGSWVSSGNDKGTSVAGNSALAIWSVGSSGADGIIAKAGTGYEVLGGNTGIIDKIAGHSLSYIEFCGYNDPVCVEDRQFSCWSDWEEGVCVNGWKTETRTRTEYDANSCGTFQDVIHEETRDEECDIPCVENRTFGEWSSWENSTECVNDLLTQVRTRVEYDANVCGYFNNVTRHDSRSIPCETPCVPNLMNTTKMKINETVCIGGWKTESWDWVKYDANSCEGSVNVTYSEQRSEECEMPCVPNRVNESWSGWNLGECVGGWKTDTRTRTEYDANSCEGSVNVTYTDSRNEECGTPECYTDLECGIPHCAGGPNYCFGGNVYQDFLVPECINPGQLDAYCSYEKILPWELEVCQWGCLNGICLPCPIDTQFTDWSEWENETACVDGLISQTRNRVEYDANSCPSSVNETREETRTISCEIPCVPEIVNGSWGEWDVGECVDGWKTQTRTLVEYDANSCEGSVNVTYTETKDTECGVSCVENITFGEWTSWTNSSECVDGLMNQTRTQWEYDANYCGNFTKVLHEENRVVECGDDPECCEDDQCETDYSERYCVGDDLYERNYDYFCETTGLCDLEVTETFLEECEDYCSDGICKREKRDGDIRHNSTNFERFESVNYYGENAASGELDTISLDENGTSGKDFDWVQLFPWILVILILILFLLIIVLF